MQNYDGRWLLLSTKVIDPVICSTVSRQCYFNAQKYTIKTSPGLLSKFLVTGVLAELVMCFYS